MDDSKKDSFSSQMRPSTTLKRRSQAPPLSPPMMHPHEATGASSSRPGQSFSTPDPLMPIVDEKSAERFSMLTGGVDINIKSEDKEFHMLPADERVWAVASQRTIQREYDALRLIQKHGGVTTLAGGLQDVNKNGKRTEAYPMRWVHGATSSKSNAKEFKELLMHHRDEPSLLESMQKLEDLSRRIDVQDFQVLFDPVGKSLIINDPRSASALKQGVGQGEVMGRRLKEWREAMQVHETHSAAASSRPKPRAAAPQEQAEPRPLPSPTRADVKAHNAWRVRALEFVPADMTSALFAPEEAQRFHERREAVDRGGTRWRHQHYSASENRIYLRPNPPTARSDVEVASGPRLTMSSAPSSPSVPLRPSSRPPSPLQTPSLQTPSLPDTSTPAPAPARGAGVPLPTASSTPARQKPSAEKAKKE